MTDELRYPEHWTTSRLHDYDKCPLLYKKRYVERLPEPPRELKPGQTEHANDRGSRIHAAGEAFIQGDGPLTAEYIAFEKEMGLLRDLYASGHVSVEQEWGFSYDWEPTDYKTAYGRMKLDVCVIQGNKAVVVDHKTGNQYPVKHAEQMMIYGTGTMMRYPEVEIVTTELWYLDKDDLASLTFRRPDMPRLVATFRSRTDKMLADRTFKPASHMYACNMCSYKAECEFSATSNKRPATKKASSSGFFEW